jgi:hypothetical protein
LVHMKLSECEKLAEDFVRGKRNAKKVKVTTVKQKDPVTYEVKGYCDDTRFSIDINQDVADVVGYDFMDDYGSFDMALMPRELSRKP